MSENCRKCVGRLVAAKLQALTNMARLARFERATAWFVVRRSNSKFPLRINLLNRFHSPTKSASAQI